MSFLLDDLLGFWLIVLLSLDCQVELELANIYYFISRGHNIIAVTKMKEYEFIGKLDQVENDLNKMGFVRIHKSYLVNMRYIFTMAGNRAIFKKEIINLELNISRRYKNTARDTYMMYRGQGK